MQFLGIYEHTTVWNVCVLNQFMVSSHGQYSRQNSIILLSKGKINNETLNNSNFRLKLVIFYYYLFGASLCVWFHSIQQSRKGSHRDMKYLALACPRWPWQSQKPNYCLNTEQISTYDLIWARGGSVINLSPRQCYFLCQLGWKSSTGANTQMAFLVHLWIWALLQKADSTGGGLWPFKDPADKPSKQSNSCFHSLCSLLSPCSSKLTFILSPCHDFSKLCLYFVEVCDILP